MNNYNNSNNDAIHSEFTTMVGEMCEGKDDYKKVILNKFDNPFKESTNTAPSTQETNTNTSFMLTMIFCWKYADELIKNDELIKKPPQKGGMFALGSNSDDESSVSSKSSVSSESDDRDDRDVAEFLKPVNRNRRRIMITLSLFMQIFFLFLLFEQFRLLFTTIERILSVAADFNNDTGHTVLGFFDAGQQILLGNMVTTLLEFQNVATSRIEESIRSIAVESQRTIQASYFRGIATFVNDYLTGSSTDFAITSGREELRFQQQTLLQEGIHRVNVQYNDLTMQTQSLTYGIINGIQGFMTSSILLIHSVDPTIITPAQVTQAIGALTASYSSPTSWANMIALANNIRLTGQATVGILSDVPLLEAAASTEAAASSTASSTEASSSSLTKLGKGGKKKKKGGKKKRKRTQKKKKGGKKKSTRKRK